jgi:hypothetical protein
MLLLAFEIIGSYGLLWILAILAIYFVLAGFGTYFGIAYLHFHIPLPNRIREAAAQSPQSALDHDQ